MQTTPYKKVRDGAARLLGLNPETELNQALARQLAEAITLRTAEGWNREWWPDWTPVEERTADADRFISFTQTGEAVIDRLQSITRRDPRLNPRNAWAVEYDRVPGGVVLGPEEPTTVFISYQAPPPQFTDTIWSAATTYAVGDLVYLPSTGECYQAILASTNASPSVTPASWAVQSFPALLAPFVKRAAGADLQSMQKQADTALRTLDLAYADLERAVTHTFPETGAYHTVAVGGYGANLS